MEPPDPKTEIFHLQAAGLLLPPVLTLEDVRRALSLRSVDAVFVLYQKEGLPLATCGDRVFVARHMFRQWLDRRTEVCGSLAPSSAPLESEVPGNAEDE